MKRRHLILLLGGAGSGAMSVGTGAFSSVEADREVDVSVVGDEEAYLGIEQVSRVIPVEDTDAAEAGATEVIELRNQFAADLAVGVVPDFGETGDDDEPELELSEDDGDGDDVEDAVTIGEDPRGDGDDGALSPGSSAALELEREAFGRIDFEVTFYGEAGEATVDATREFSVWTVGVDFVSEGEGNGVVRLTGEFPEVSLKLNGDHRGTLRSADNGSKSGNSGEGSDGGDSTVKTTIRPDEGEQIETVTIDGVTYVRDDDDDSDDDDSDDSDDDDSDDSDDDSDDDDEN